MRKTAWIILCGGFLLLLTAACSKKEEKKGADEGDDLQMRLEAPAGTPASELAG